MKPAFVLAFACLAMPAAAQEGVPPGALACTGCHGLFEGAPFPIQQLSSDEIATAMAEFRDGTREGTIMPRFAVAFSDDETRAIADWFADEGRGQ
jgi:cytochrome subunit of sulfide dehydrogenase